MNSFGWIKKYFKKGPQEKFPNSQHEKITLQKLYFIRRIFGLSNADLKESTHYLISETSPEDISVARTMVALKVALLSVDVNINDLKELSFESVQEDTEWSQNENPLIWGARLCGDLAFVIDEYVTKYDTMARAILDHEKKYPGVLPKDETLRHWSYETSDGIIFLYLVYFQRSIIERFGKVYGLC
ncbi:MAG: hypothetical protein AAB870_02420 [Patescibacteria group bacterium]